MSTPLWRPPSDAAGSARIASYSAWLAEQGLTGPLPADDYNALWKWSTQNLEQFWASIWDYFEVGDRPDGPVLAGGPMPDTSWFPGARLNYVGHIFRHADPNAVAIVSAREGESECAEVTFADLRQQVSSMASTLREFGVRSGDRVVGYLPNSVETVVSFLATASIGAVWACCGQDYAPRAAADRLSQLEPRVLIASTGYTFAGRRRDHTEAVAELRGLLTTVEHTIVVGRSDASQDSTTTWSEAVAHREQPFTPDPVSFDHPLWVVFSSGTTGRPKGLVHGHGGVLLEHLKALGLHFDLSPGDRLFWYSSPSWMMWNFQVSALLLGSSIVCYDGSPAHPGPDATWEVAARTGTTVLGTSPGYVRSCEEAGSALATDHDLSALRTVGVTGAPFPHSSAMWLRDALGADVPAVSITGGTDVVTAFLGGSPTVPIWPGKISCPWLGVAAESLDDEGRPVRDQVGELVITAPMPSMPLFMWNDDDGERYRRTYFDTYPGIWQHGDWVTFTAGEGISVHGRSDATLNRNGIRIGTADVYAIVEGMDEVSEAMVLGIENPDGSYWMPLFVAPAPGWEITDRIRALITHRLKVEASPRHVPDEIIEAPGIPHTKTGKKLEVPIKRMLLGRADADDLDVLAVEEPELLAWYGQFAERSALKRTE